jgi:hypothetical protein
MSARIARSSVSLDDRRQAPSKTADSKSSAHAAAATATMMKNLPIRLPIYSSDLVDAKQPSSYES